MGSYDERCLDSYSFILPNSVAYVLVRHAKDISVEQHWLKEFLDFVSEFANTDSVNI